MDNVQILTLEPWTKGTLLLRLEHIFEANENRQLSKNVTVNVRDLFSTFEILSMRETTLDGNQWSDETTKWGTVSTKTETNDIHDFLGQKKLKEFINFAVTLRPMEIRTFILNIRYY